MESHQREQSKSLLDCVDLIVGAWFHPSGLERIEDTGFDKASEVGFSSVRTYNYEHSEKIAGELKKRNMSLYAGVEVRSGEFFDASDLVHDWRSQLRSDHVLRTHKLGVPLVALCRGNELREYLKGEPPNWRFTERISQALCKLLSATKSLIHEHGFSTPVTYAMEGLELGQDGKLSGWVVPIVEAVDVFSVNCYPMEAKDWFTLDAFKHNRQFLSDEEEAKSRLTRLEHGLRSLLGELEKFDKPLILSETGMHAGIGFRTEKRTGEKETVITTREGKRIIPIQDPKGFGKAYMQFASMLRKVSRDFPERIKGLYIYEWRDNPYHGKIQTENSPVHACFGLCHVDGTPKFELSNLTSTLAMA